MKKIGKNLIKQLSLFTEISTLLKTISIKSMLAVKNMQISYLIQANYYKILHIYSHNCYKQL